MNWMGCWHSSLHPEGGAEKVRSLKGQPRSGGSAENGESNHGVEFITVAIPARARASEGHLQGQAGFRSIEISQKLPSTGTLPGRLGNLMKQTDAVPRHV